MHLLVLASKSPRRQNILRKLQIPFTVVSPQVDESISFTLPPDEIVTQLAKRKAMEVALNFPESYVIGSDTIVAHQGKVFGKPQNELEACQMLEQLSGQVHSVYTGVAIIHGEKEAVFYEKTDVEFWELTSSDIHFYIESGEPFDKAGAYGIQGLGALLVKAIYGDYYSVVGLPISRISRELIRLGLDIRFDKDTLEEE